MSGAEHRPEFRSFVETRPIPWRLGHGSLRPAGESLSNVPVDTVAKCGALVIEDGGDEDEAIAAPLDDVMEDQGGRP